MAISESSCRLLAAPMLIRQPGAIHTCVTDVTEAPAGLTTTRDLTSRESDDITLK